MQGDPNSSQSQYLFSIHHDTCNGVYSNKTSVQATLIVQVKIKTKYNQGDRKQTKIWKKWAIQYYPYFWSQRLKQVDVY